MQLAIPQHWRFSPLLASLGKSAGGHLLRTGTAGGGHLAKCSDCLCDVPKADSDPDCSCFDSDYGTPRVTNAIQVDVTGTTSPVGDPAKVGCTPSGCASIVGTYIKPACGVFPTLWCVYAFVCDNVYYFSQIRVAWTRIPASSLWRVEVIIGSRTATSATSKPTTPILCDVPFFVTNTSRTLIYETPTVNRTDWRYQLGDGCAESCNETRSVIGCPALPTLVSDIATTSPTAPACSVTGYNVAISFV